MELGILLQELESQCLNDTSTLLTILDICLPDWKEYREVALEMISNLEDAGEITPDFKKVLANV